jgi:PncC family amidohydrolase
MYPKSDSEIFLAISSLHHLLLKQGLTVCTAESCTGGLLGAAFTELAGSSGYFLGGIIAYSNSIKQNVLGVSGSTLERFGAVSEQTALEMAQRARNLMSANLAVATTGVAGPSGGSKDKPVGAVWIALSDKKNSRAYSFQFEGERSEVRRQTVLASIHKTRDFLNIG